MKMEDNNKDIMRTVNLSKKWTEHCSNMPESGMGYQRVICKINKNGREISIPATILNGSILESVIPIDEKDIVNIVLKK